MTDRTATPTVTGAWVVGHNMPGYLPTADTYAVADWFDAWAILAGELDRYAEDDDNAYQEIECGHADEEDHDAECFGATRALVDGIMADAEREGLVNENQDFTVTVADNDDRLTTFFLVWSPDSEPDED